MDGFWQELSSLNWDCALACGRISGTRSELQSAAFKMSVVVVPMFAAFDEDAPLTEWALNVDVSTPTASSTSFSHLVVVLDITATVRLDECYE